MYCTMCGNQIPETARFCTSCGHPVQQEEDVIPAPAVSENLQSESVEEIQPAPVPVEPVYEQPAQVVTGSTEQNEDKPKRKWLLPLLIIFTGILMLVIIALLFLKFSSGTDGLSDKLSSMLSISEDDAEVEEDTDESETDAEDEEAKEEEPEPTPEPVTAQMLLTEGKESLVSGDYEKAWECYCDAKALEADNEEIYLFGADVCLVQDNYEEALMILDEGISTFGSEALALRKTYVANNIVLQESASEDYYLHSIYEYDEYGNVIKDACQEYAYDENGNLAEETIYNTDGSFYEKRGYKYDASGRILQMMYYKEDGSTMGWMQYEYSEDSKIVNEVFYDENSNIAYWFGYAYSDEGIKEKKIYHESDGDVAYWYEYDAVGNQLREIHNKSNGKVDWWNELVYDENGNVTSEVEYNYRGKVNWRGEYTYDANGNRLKSVTYNGSNKVTDWREHQYDREGRLIKYSICGHDGTPQSWEEYIYDEEGNQIKYTQYNENGIATDWQDTEYIEDENGNTIIIVYDEKGQEESRMTINALGLIVNEYVGEWNAEYNYSYTYIGNITSLDDIATLSGTLQVSEEVALPSRRVPDMHAKPVIGENGGSYQVIGETDEFYQLDNGWFVQKDLEGITFQ